MGALPEWVINVLLADGEFQVHSRCLDLAASTSAWGICGRRAFGKTYLEIVAKLAGSGHLFGLCVRLFVRPLASMLSAGRGP